MFVKDFLQTNYPYLEWYLPISLLLIYIQDLDIPYIFQIVARNLTITGISTSFKLNTYTHFNSLKDVKKFT
jgi:hypothetical protein